MKKCLENIMNNIKQIKIFQKENKVFIPQLKQLIFIILHLQNMMMKSVAVSGTMATINADANTRYICGEMSELEFNPPQAGIANVIFTSGSSRTILTLPNTVKMPDWFEVEANMTYEISIADGVYGVVTSWAV